MKREQAESSASVGLHILITGLTGFDVSNAVRVCNPSFSDSLNGEKKIFAVDNDKFALAA
jgi:hypothetical protein